MSRYRTLESLTDVVCLLLWDNERIYSVRDYYADVVIPFNPSHFRVSTSESHMMTCPFHQDATPSMGVLTGRDGFERFTCFGCKTFGHVVDMHQRFQKDYLKRVLSRDAAAQELLARRGLDASQFERFIGSTVDIEALRKGAVSSSFDEVLDSNAGAVQSHRFSARQGQVSLPSDFSELRSRVSSVPQVSVRDMQQAVNVARGLSGEDRAAFLNHAVFSRIESQGFSS